MKPPPAGDEASTEHLESQPGLRARAYLRTAAPAPVGRRVAKALSALWLSRVVAIALNLLLLPLLLHRIPAGELGVWLVMGQAGGIIVLMDFGVTSVLTRRIAIASGAQDGADPAADVHVADLLASARLIYICAAGLTLAGSLVAGWFLLARLGLDGSTLARVRIAWVLLCAAYACNLFSGLWTSLVSGLGHVAAASVLGMALGLANMVLQVALVLLGGGVIGLAVLALAGSAVQRWATIRVLRSRRPRLLSIRGRPRRELVNGLLGASFRYWLTELGAIALLRTDQIFIAGFQQPAQIPAYYAAYSAMYNMALVSIAIAEATSVFVSQMWREREPEAVHALVLRGTRIGLTLMLCGAGLMAVVGDSVIAVWIGPGRFVGRPVLLTFCAMLVLYVHQSLLLGFSRATENEAYAPCYLAAGALNLLITWLLVGPLGLLGVAMGTLIAQAATTSWFVPVSALRRLRITWGTYASQVLLPALGVAALTCGAVLLAVSGLDAGSHLWRVVAGGTAGAAATLAGSWHLILDAGTRHDIQREAAAFARSLRALAA